MTDVTANGLSDNAADTTKGRRDIGIRKRYASEKRFKAYGVAAISLGIFALVFLLFTVVSKGYTAFWQTEIRVPITFSQDMLGTPEQAAESQTKLLMANYPQLAREGLARLLEIDPEDKAAMTAAGKLVSTGVSVELRDIVMGDLSKIGTTEEVWLYADSELDSAMKGQYDLNVPESRRPISDLQLEYIQRLEAEGYLQQRFNWGLFTHGASSRAETAGVGVAILGSAYMMLIVLVLALPIGVAASIYLEEFAPKNKFTDLIEVNINNLAAVPSIVFGLLGLAVFINWFGLPRSAAVVGGLVLTLMTLPTIIIATRAALRAVPPSIRWAALGLGASKNQTVFQHVLPLAAPGILTGTIIGLAQALGETAPLLLIGMVAFVADYPDTPMDAATALPVQIYMWANEAERAFVERTSGAIMILLGFLALMNITAIFLRRRFEQRW
ncbi:phosphate ABC transporter permease PstA [Fulvimarina sp. 2208YS6-2-32]|uniref:Phosphate transport system permease protein PstA n=1 Tax=Fulvimarina uroteuthidis TaxID=3098149 RepID=A0ABU5I0A1_9HYPH|nr:phosphate ABC transporter permease PstA [Fulvimarina sp. 2208YS6-2-32]MDY8108641.1 phosphate ABC transporter permease PstA [Fulvimarina sp. 2208YS6-2-32]